MFLHNSVVDTEIIRVIPTRHIIDHGLDKGSWLKFCSTLALSRRGSMTEPKPIPKQPSPSTNHLLASRPNFYVECSFATVPEQAQFSSRQDASAPSVKFVARTRGAAILMVFGVGRVSRRNSINLQTGDERESRMYSVLCAIEADTSVINNTLKPRSSRRGKPPHYRIDFDIILSFGLTELKAQICWKEDGVEKRGPAQVVYNQAHSAF
ncbi:hypothetical protein C8J56DRAFT_1031126 [Mycena floridula]|nr:hypothetical protein C8J56DRAFT_1031126 [Mycena floridula]